MSSHGAARLLAGLLLAGCGGQLDAGSNVLHGSLPVDERSVVVMLNDGSRDNWQGEFAALLASSGDLKLEALIVNAGSEYPSIETNVAGYREMISAARDSGLRNLPDPTASVAPALTRPSSGVVEDTIPNRSEGARLILEAAAAHSSVVHPLAIVTGGALTDVADAYLQDPSLAQRAVVVSSLGQTEGDTARTFLPNGERDTWATAIVASRMRYVQVNGYYDQLLDIPEERVAELPDNAFGRWLADKRDEVLDIVLACDQLSALAVALPWFATSVQRMRPDGLESMSLVLDPTGQVWDVPGVDMVRARDELWARLKDPRTFQ